jgi:hypothetical protein
MGAAVWLCALLLQLAFGFDGLSSRFTIGRGLGECAAAQLGLVVPAREAPGDAPTQAACLECVLAAHGGFAPPLAEAKALVFPPGVTPHWRVWALAKAQRTLALGFVGSWSSRGPPPSA